MRMKALGAALGACAFLFATPAAAATFVINLTANPVNLTTGSFSIGASNFRNGNLVVDPFEAFTIAEGDVIRTTLMLADGLVVPGSMEQLFGLNFFQGEGNSPPGYAPGLGPMNEGMLTFSYSMGSTGLASDTLTGGCTNCLTTISGQVPGDAFIFDGLFVDQTITSLNAPFTIDGASFSYQLRDLAVVPEPGTWALMIVGLGAVGGALRARRQARLGIAPGRAATA